MEKRHGRAVHVFRRDLRLIDNIALNAALSESKEVVGVFILDPRQVGAQNSYRSTHFLQFMQEALADLDEALRAQGSRLYVWEGEAAEAVASAVHALGAEAVYWNADYTPFARARDEAMATTLRRAGLACYEHHDVLLNAPGKILTEKVQPYSVFTPFYRAARRHDVPKPKTARGHFAHSHVHDAGMRAVEALVAEKKLLAARGGRAHALRHVKGVADRTQYSIERDALDIEGTTLLSPYLKLGCISVREVWWEAHTTLGQSAEVLLRQLYWRDFFTHLTFFHPEVLGRAFKPLYDRMQWDEPGEKFERWKAGRTGFPIVDAGMRQLNESGWMHNRARMITASFLTKDLHLDWRLGERYFATQLIDYDPAVNNGSWQWVAGTGADAAPYFRVFNPWLQQKKFDPEARYIQRWVPELAEMPAEDIHRWYERVGRTASEVYPAPMLDHREEAEETKRRFGRALH